MKQKEEYKWVVISTIKKYKKNITPLKASTFLFNDLPVIKRGKYKGYIGINGLVLCLFKK